ncbi:MAG TPA: tetratricopeptide repeat protein [Candidatus Binataceae bacterium]|nr:tetratricopeptide repeat protein [Candidatus Binataceae bacterium]
MPRHKITRKELKQPTDFQSLAENVQDFVLGNLRQVIISAVIVLVAAAAAFGMYTYERGRDRQAGDAFYGALTALGAKQYKIAEIQFASLGAAEPNRRIGKLARLYLAQAYQGEGDLGKARDALIAFVADYHDPEFSSLALMDLGVVYERMGDLHKAQGAYQQAAGVPGPEQLRAELAIARMLSEQGDSAGAIQAYRAFLVLRPYAQQRAEVLESLAMLGAGPAEPQAHQLAAPAGAMPVVIPPPAAATSAAH